MPDGKPVTEEIKQLKKEVLGAIADLQKSLKGDLKRMDQAQRKRYNALSATMQLNKLDFVTRSEFEEFKKKVTRSQAN